MTIPLKGADSSSPLPVPAGTEIYGCYVAGDTPHVWTGQEFRDLGEHGVKGVMPIVVPPQDEEWWTTEDGAEELVRLVAGARAWGLHVGSPLCLDIEEAQAEKMGAQAKAVEERFAGACATYGYLPWSYGGKTWHDAVGTGHGKRWLADWTTEAPTEIPAGYDAIQYAGYPDGSQPDKDLFAPGTYFGLNGEPVDLPLASSPEPSPAPEPVTPEPEPATPQPETPQPEPEQPETETAIVTEAEATASATEAQSSELEKTVDAPVTPTHQAEIHDLTAKIRVHLQELDDLADKESPK